MLWLGSYYRGTVLIHSPSNGTVLRGQVHLQKVSLVTFLRYFLLFLQVFAFFFLSALSLTHARLGWTDQAQADGTEPHTHCAGIEGSTIVLCDIHQYTWKER